VLENWSKAHLKTILFRKEKILFRKEKGLCSVHQRLEVEHWCFPPLVLSAFSWHRAWRLGPIAKAIYKKLTSAMVATKHNQSYSQTISWLQCRFSSSIMCLRGSCFSAGNPQFTEATIDRAICDGKVALK